MTYETPLPHPSVARPETGDDDFESVALPHLDAIFRTARRILGNRAEAEELTQETFYQAWKSFSRYTPGTNCKAWLFTILFHMIARHRRTWLRTYFVGAAPRPIESVLVYRAPVPEHIRDEEILA